MLPSGPVPSFPNTTGLQSGPALNKLAGLIGSTQNNIVAHAGGTKAAATQLTAAMCNVTTCATNGDSVLLPPGYPGLEVIISNKGAADLQVFGSGLDTINDVATATGVTQADPLTALYKCSDVVAGVGKWYRILSA